MRREPGFPWSFACRRSGNCCSIPGGFVRVTNVEATAIARGLGIELAAFYSRYVQGDGQTLKEGLGHRCVFLQDGREAGCTIYESRPQKCRDWPFWPEARTDAKLRELMLRTCPGIAPDAVGPAGC